MRDNIDASRLRALLEEKHGEPAMHWKDQFALGCWLHLTGHERAGRKMIDGVLDSVRQPGNLLYLEAVSERAALDPAAIATAIWPHAEIVDLFENLTADHLCSH